MTQTNEQEFNPFNTRHMRKLLNERWPLAFMAKGQQKRPLAIGIRDQIVAAAPELDSQAVRRAIMDYVRGHKYQGNMIEGALRVNLDGTDAAPVTAQDAGYAAMVTKHLLRNWPRVMRRMNTQAIEEQLRHLVKGNGDPERINVLRAELIRRGGRLKRGLVQAACSNPEGDQIGGG